MFKDKHPKTLNQQNKLLRFLLKQNVKNKCFNYIYTVIKLWRIFIKVSARNLNSLRNISDSKFRRQWFKTMKGNAFEE